MPIYNTMGRVNRRTALPLAEEMIRSISEQTHTDFQLTILDNQSTDGTVEFVRRLTAGDARVSVDIDDEQCLAEVAIRKLSDRAQGPFTAIVNDDDVLAPQFLEQLVARSLATQSDLTYPNARWIDTQGALGPRLNRNPQNTYSGGQHWRRDLAHYLRVRNSVPISFGLWRTATFQRVGRVEAFDSFGRNHDHALIGSALISGIRICPLDQDLMAYRRRLGRAIPTAPYAGELAPTDTVGMFLRLLRNEWSLAKLLIRRATFGHLGDSDTLWALLTIVDRAVLYSRMAWLQALSLAPATRSQFREMRIFRKAMVPSMRDALMDSGPSLQLMDTVRMIQLAEARATTLTEWSHFIQTQTAGGHSDVGLTTARVLDEVASSLRGAHGG